ncbi:protein-disulfide reductase DsbD domain-containing protein, partial [Bacteroides heparinolyticus]
MKNISLSFFLLLFAMMVQAQIQDPVKFKSEWKTLPGGEAEVVFTASIDKGWHVYSTDLGDGGPISATFNVERLSGVETVGKLRPAGKEISAFDRLFEMKVRYFEHTARFVQKLKLTGSTYQVEGYLEYGACNDENCLPPTQVPFKFSGEAEGVARENVASVSETNVADVSAPQEAVAADTVSAANVDGVGVLAGGDVPNKSDLWKPVIDELK